ncbi:MAG: PAS domain S-box protein [Thermoguttaceae bacterium]|jgi:PAS domain S-box-containing protein
MNTLIVAVAARWEERLRELLTRRGHSFSVINDLREIGPALQRADYTLSFVGTDEADDEGMEICRRLRAASGAKPLEILICGAMPNRDKIQALLSAGANDCLTDPDNDAELEFRLTLAEIRASRRSDSEVIERPGYTQHSDDVCFDGAPKGFFRSSLEGKFIEADQALVKMFGYKSRDELLQVDISRDIYADPSMRLQLLSELSTENKTHEFFCKRRDGRPIAIRITWRRVFDDAGNFLYFEGTIQDISESAKDPKLLRIQYDLALKLSSTFDLSATLNEILDAAMRIEGVDCGGIYLFNGTSNKFELAASIGFPEWFKQALSQYSLDESQMQYIMQGRPLHLTVGEVQLPNRGFFEKAGIKSGIIAPVTHQGQVIATLNLASRPHKTILPGARRAIEAIALQVGGIVARAQAETARQIGRQNLQSLYESESRFRAIFENAAVGLALGNLQGIMLVVNSAFAKMLGYMPAELVGKRYTEYTHPDDVGPQQALLKDLFEGKHDKFLLEKRYIHKNGGSIWGRLNISIIRDSGGEPLYGIGIIENITDRKQAEDRLRENESLLRGLFENLPDFIILVDQNAKILFANRDTPGATKEAIIGMDGFGFVRASHQSQCRETFYKALSTGTVREVDSFDVFDHHWSCRIVPFVEHIAGGYAVVICTDITEQKRSAEAIQKEQQLLRRIIDLHERDRQITAYEIHDGIAQQVTASLLHLEAFRRLRESDAKTAEKSLETTLDLISQSVDEARRLISGLRPLILDEYGIVEAIDYLVCENRERSGKQIDFRHDVRFKRLAPPLESAAFRIVQESLSNACRHSRSPIIIVELVQRDDRLHIKVRDQGVGFDPNAVEESRFGLRSIRERARLLGGRAEILSAPGSGTSITVELPVVLQVDEEAY